MRRISSSMCRRQEQPPAFFHSSDPNLPEGEELELYLRPLSADRELWVTERWRELLRIYLPDNKALPEVHLPDFKAPPEDRIPLFPVSPSGARVMVSGELLFNAVALVAMQVPQDVEPYTEFDFCHFSADYPDAFRALLVFSQTVNADQKKGSTPPGGDVLPPSPGSSEPIPTCLNGSEMPSGV